MQDNLTDDARRRLELQEQINANPKTKEELEDLFGPGNVWDTDALRAEFEVRGFAAPFCVVARWADGKRGTLAFQHHPRLYFDFRQI